MKIGLFSDTHYCSVETLEQNRKPRRAYETVKKAFDDFDKFGVDVAVCLGDLVHYNDGIIESANHLRKISMLIHSYKIPCCICLGNHDYEVFNHDDYERVSGLQAAPLCKDFGTVRLVFVDAGYTPDGKPFEQKHVDWTLSYVPHEQLIWLDKELDTPKKCIVFIHQNIDKNVEEHHIVSNADEVNDIISKHDNVIHVFQGHYHYGAENKVNGIPYTTLRAMCIGNETNYMIYDVKGDITDNGTEGANLFHF